MQLKPQTIDAIARMICGDTGFSEFPYRSSSKLTSFFLNLSLPYTHDGSTRHIWVKNILLQLNLESDLDSNQMSENLKNVIESILDPTYFHSDTTAKRERAFDKFNKFLKSEGLTLADDSKGIAHLQGLGREFISTSVSELEVKRVITFSPSVFTIPNKPVQADLVSVMMPFSMEFDSVLTTVKETCSEIEMDCKRVDDIWQNSTIIQDIFELIFRSSIVVADLSGRNPNVFYEIGIAHTLGKIVVPITQNLDDVPFDLKHHRALVYLKNEQGLLDLKKRLVKRLTTVKQEL